ncbi:hypothetical protein [Spiroplasma turonicum]|uniref:Uncharacterized protein n=1 Tax=Spiroplasma turonicum TaxID=216946 RepID=A0A0K1P7J3_9MOLU|nr:hypothetical protein [Spiroplasma turonicum]AKU79877.1 hypothetical protein STURON_00631 [Spiroplasma turonicum]ALX70889.1 hypothetical protein STURO_v1c06280 [Spiroplasma turonicum]
MIIYDIRTTTQVLEKEFKNIEHHNENTLNSQKLFDDNLIADQQKFVNNIADYLIHYLNIYKDKEEKIKNNPLWKNWIIDCELVFIYFNILNKIISFIELIIDFISNKASETEITTECLNYYDPEEIILKENLKKFDLCYKNLLDIMENLCQ